MRTAFDLLAQRGAMAAASAQEAVIPTTPTEVPSVAAPELAAVGGGDKNTRAKFALVGTVMFVALFAAIAWPLGNLIGESLLKSASEAVS